MRDSFQQQQVVASALPRSLSLVAAAAVTAGLAVVKGHAILPWATLPPSRLRLHSAIEFRALRLPTVRQHGV